MSKKRIMGRVSTPVPDALQHGWHGAGAALLSPSAVPAGAGRKGARKLDQITPELTSAAAGFWADIQAFAQSMMVPWRLYQLAAIAGIYAFAWILKRVISPRFTDWLRAKEGLPKWQLRWAVVINKRWTLIFFSLTAWLTVAVMQQITWPSRSQIIDIAASVATAILAVQLAGKLIRNRTLSRLVTWAASIWVVSYLLNVQAQMFILLDRVGVDLGSFRLSVLTVIKALLIMGLLVLAARFLTRTVTDRIKGNEDISPSMQVLAIKVMQLVLYGGAIYIGLKAVGFDLTGLAVLSGAIGVGLGFGLQKVVSNLVSGIIILLDKSVKPGDVISLGETFGWIESLGARFVSVVTRDGKEYLIPNEDLITGQVVNWSHSDEFVRLDLHFCAAYADDPHHVRKVAVEAALGVSRVLKTRAPVCHVTGFGDSSVDYVLRFWIRDPTDGLTNIRGNVYLALWDAFKEHAFSHPFPQREVKVLGGTMPGKGRSGTKTPVLPD